MWIVNSTHHLPPRRWWMPCLPPWGTRCEVLHRSSALLLLQPSHRWTPPSSPALQWTPKERTLFINSFFHEFGILQQIATRHHWFFLFINLTKPQSVVSRSGWCRLFYLTPAGLSEDPYSVCSAPFWDPTAFPTRRGNIIHIRKTKKHVSEAELWNSCNHTFIMFRVLSVGWFPTCSFFTILAWLIFSSSIRFLTLSARCWNSWAYLRLRILSSVNVVWSFSRALCATCEHLHTHSRERVWCDRIMVNLRCFLKELHLQLIDFF